MKLLYAIVPLLISGCATQHEAESYAKAVDSQMRAYQQAVEKAVTRIECEAGCSVQLAQPIDPPQMPKWTNANDAWLSWGNRLTDGVLGLAPWAFGFGVASEAFKVVEGGGNITHMTTTTTTSGDTISNSGNTTTPTTIADSYNTPTTNTGSFNTDSSNRPVSSYNDNSNNPANSYNPDSSVYTPTYNYTYPSP